MKMDDFVFAREMRG